MRTFRDAAGIEWTVFEVRRANEETNWAYLPRGFRSGWLCFESSVGKRRLSPVPDGWRSLDEDGLERMLTRAASVGKPGRAAEGEIRE
jgi:hypothetical protein